MVGLVSLRLTKDDMAPTLGAMDMPLSFKTTMRSLLRSPALFRPSKAIPRHGAVADHRNHRGALLQATGAGDSQGRGNEVELCPVSKASYSSRRAWGSR
jgi:hypothetical protein